MNSESSQEPIEYSKNFQPTSYPEVEGWINSFNYQEWVALVGAYTAGGFYNVIVYMKKKYSYNLQKWGEKDLNHFFNSHPLNKFKTKYERVMR